MSEPKPNRPPNNTVRVALMGSLYGTHWVNRFWLNVTPSGSPGATEVLGLSNAVAAAFRTRFGAVLTTAWQSQTQRTVWFKDATTEIAVDGSDTGAGSLTAAPESAQVCYLVNWLIAGSYRGGHPRTYLAGVTTDGLTNVNALTNTRRTALTTAATNFLNDVNALTPSGFSSVGLGTIRFFRNHAALAPPVFEPYLGGSGASLIATQRRRIGR